MNDAVRAMPRQIVTASAGCGKTFTLSSRLIGLLGADQAPESLFASTFTRKAAGEILDRVLVRLAEAALDKAKAAELAQYADPGHVTGSRCLELVGELTRQLHRLNISTLDSFMVRAVKSFSLELGLPPGWTIADAVVDQQIRADAVHAVLAQHDPQVLIELLRLLHQQSPRRSVHQYLLELADRLHDVYRQAERHGDDPWHVVDRPRGRPPLDTDERVALAERIAQMPVPATRDGKPQKLWVSAQRNLVNALMADDWEAIVDQTIVSNVAQHNDTFSRTPIPPDWHDAIDVLLSQARHVLLRQFVDQADAMQKLMRMYDQQFRRIQWRRGAYRFGDVTDCLARAADERLDLHYRLDGRIEHLLLDEFQDTSQSQWQALEPLADEILGDASGERASLIVADAKQSIYGWREADVQLLERLQARYQLDEVPQHRSWRSSQVVLDVVNRVFADLAANPVLAGEHRDTAEHWLRSFAPHEAARDLSGHVRLLTGPVPENARKPSLTTLPYAAEVVADLAEQWPGYTIGVLTRTNAGVARLIYHLHRRGVTASEEGGSRLTDSPAVLSVLAALRMADHPGDTIARYHVANTPVGDVVGVHDHGNDVAAHRAAHAIRRALITNGYGPTLLRWTEQLAAHCDGRELARLMQLVELACEHDATATLRPGTFVRLVEQQRVEDPNTSAVRVMTVHQAKGLEFDIVVLPELDEPIFRGGGEQLMVGRDAQSGRITAVLPYMKKSIRALFPQIEPAYQQGRAVIMRDALGALYVAMTRARYALHMIVAPPGKSDSGCTPGRLLRCALADEKVEAEQVVYESGTAAWGTKVAEAAAPAVEAALAPRLAPAVNGGGRMLAGRSPSQLEGGDKVDIADLLRPGQSGATQRGSVFHAWFELVEWVDDGEPDDAQLRQAAATFDIAEEDVSTWFQEFRAMLASPAIRAALSRSSYPPSAQVWRERRFAVRDGQGLLTGAIDRMVVVREGDRIASAEVLDFKTDHAPDEAAVDSLVEHYRPQIEAYRSAVAKLTHVPAEKITAKLLFVGAGVTRSV